MARSQRRKAVLAVGGAEINRADAIDSQRSAIVLRNLEGTPSVQLYTWKNIDLPPGRYIFRLDYMTGGDVGAGLNLNLKGMNKREIELPASARAWKRFSTIIEVANQGVSLSPQFRPSGAGADKALYLRSISMRRLKEESPQ